MRWPARLGATLSVLLLLSCASSAPEPPADPGARAGNDSAVTAADGARVPDPPPKVRVDVDGPASPSLVRLPWIVPRPRLQVHVRAPDAAVRSRVRRTESDLQRARRRLQGAWSFVQGETVGMAIFEESGRLVFQAMGGEKVSLDYRVVRAPGPDAGRVQLRTLPDSGASGPAAGATPGGDGGDERRRFRALFKWRSSGQLDLQVPVGGGAWPKEFGPDRYRLFRDVEEALRYLHRRERGWPGATDLHRAD